MSRTKFMGIFLVILGVISVVVGIIRGDMTSSAAMFIGYLVPALLGAVILIVDHVGGGESKTETGPSDAALAGQNNKKKKSRCPDGQRLSARKKVPPDIPVRRNA